MAVVTLNAIKEFISTPLDTVAFEDAELLSVAFIVLNHVSLGYFVLISVGSAK